MTIDIVCKVVDNYGDIGVAFRLARSLSDRACPPIIRLIVDRLDVFAAIEPELDPTLCIQALRGWTVLAWDPSTQANGSGDKNTLEAYEALYKTNPPRLIIECFACGRPLWLEDMLFAPENTMKRTIINLEYLSAEDYALEFHMMPSLTRSGAVKKHIFMPGFSPGTGGLILDDAFMSLRSAYSNKAASLGANWLSKRIGLLEGLCQQGWIPSDELESMAKRFWVPVFAYERNYERIVEDLASFDRRTQVMALVAAGKSQECFIAAWKRGGEAFPVIRLPFMRQEAWDEVLIASDFLIVRGEDSLSRAALSGRPFLWHAYPQSEAHQLVKVRALLSRLRPYIDMQSFEAIESAFIAFNDRLIDGENVYGDESILPLLENIDSLSLYFEAFSEGLIKNGDLANKLMTFIGDIV